MSLIEDKPYRAGAAMLALILLLGACSDRDTKLSEAMSTAERAAMRAEKAADRAEEAASKLGTQPAPVVLEDDEEPEADESEKASFEQTEPPVGDSDTET